MLSQTLREINVHNNNIVKCDHDFYGKLAFFREIGVYTEEVTKELISRIFFFFFANAFYSSFQYCAISIAGIFASRLLKDSWPLHAQ